MQNCVSIEPTPRTDRLALTSSMSMPTSCLSMRENDCAQVKFNVMSGKAYQTEEPLDTDKNRAFLCVLIDTVDKASSYPNTTSLVKILNFRTWLRDVPCASVNGGAFHENCQIATFAKVCRVSTTDDLCNPFR